MTTPGKKLDPSSAEAGATARRKSHPFLNWKTAVGVAISAGLLWYTFRGQDLGEMVHEMGQADPLLLLLATALATFVFWIRAWRWRCILDPVQRGTTFHSRFAAVNIGFMANNLLPARVGEFARAYAVSRLEPIPVVAALSSLVIERMLDALTLVVLLFVAAAMPGFPDWPTSAEVDFPRIARTLGITVALATVVLFLLVLWPRQTVRAFETIANRILPLAIRRPLVNALEAFLAGATILRNARLMVEAVAWSAVLWLVNSAAFWLAFRAFGLDLDFSVAVFFNSGLGFIVAVPAAPGFWGTYEFAARIMLVGLWAQETSTVLAFAVGFHIAGFLPVTLMGLYYASRLGLSLSGVARTEEVVEEAVERQTQRETD
ncbi:MAG TPA: lysylphosphatidylglycerol synthase transmembrane domain-containing protein [Longimicrobiales bacterium]|nr:lysylphosphatidylglycerol synthase transmembrane domain-containing protein [Longimicrobiales bacterium]